MARKTLAPYSTIDVTVPYGHSVAVLSIGDEIVRIYYETIGASPPVFYLHDTLRDGKQTYGPFAAPNKVRISTAGQQAIYDIGNPPSVGGEPLLYWEEDGDNLRPVVSGSGTVGDSTHLVEALYLGDNNPIYIGDDQDLEIYHDGTNAYITENTGTINVAGGLYLNTIHLDVDNDYGIRARETGGTARVILGVNSSDIVQVGNANNATDILSNGTLTHNSVDLITDLLPAQATHSGEFLTTDGAGSLSWAAAGGSGLSTWEENGNDFRPVTTSISDIGDSTHRIVHLYHTDDGYNYFGDSNDMHLRHSGSHGYFWNYTGNLLLGTESGAGSIYLRTNGSSRWQIDTAGVILPATTNTYDIGSTTLCVNDMYFGDSGTIYFGDGQDMSMYHDGSNGYISLAETLFVTGTAATAVVLDNDTYYGGEEVGGTARNLLGVTTADYARIGNESLEMSILTSGNIYANSSNIVLDNNYYVRLKNTSASAVNVFGMTTSDQVRFGNGSYPITFLSDNNIYAAGIYNTTTSARNVYVDATGLLGYLSSSAKSKENIEDIDDTEWIYDLKPKKFNYRSDPDKSIEYGLIADDLEKIRPDLCFYDIDEKTGKKEVAGINYRSFTAILINEIKKLRNDINQYKPASL